MAPAPPLCALLCRPASRPRLVTSSSGCASRIMTEATCLRRRPACLGSRVPPGKQQSTHTGVLSLTQAFSASQPGQDSSLGGPWAEVRVWSCPAHCRTLSSLLACTHWRPAAPSTCCRDTRNVSGDGQCLPGPGRNLMALMGYEAQSSRHRQNPQSGQQGKPEHHLPGGHVTSSGPHLPNTCFRVRSPSKHQENKTRPQSAKHEHGFEGQREACATPTYVGLHVQGSL